MQVLRKFEKISSFSAAFLKIRRKAAEKLAFRQLLRRAAFYFRKGFTVLKGREPLQPSLYLHFLKLLHLCFKLFFVLSGGGGWLHLKIQF